MKQIDWPVRGKAQGNTLPITELHSPINDKKVLTLVKNQTIDKQIKISSCQN